MATADELHWLALRAVPGIGIVLFQRLVEKFGEPAAVFGAAPEELAQVKGLRPAVIQALQQFSDWDHLRAMLSRLRRWGVEIITWRDEKYPAILRRIPYAPPFFFLKGTLLPEDDPAVAIVGTRQLSHYGRRTAARLAGDLAREGITVVSGLARGIDTVVHQAVLEAGGRTLAVLGCGLDVIYPPENRELYRRVAAQGALITEFPLGTPPEARNFPLRNRLISGLARAVVIVEAGEQSGALITADFAAEQGRDVFAVPGSIFQRGCRGTNRLIRDGAQPVLSANDVLEALNLTGVAEHVEAQMLFPTDATEAALLEQLSDDPTHVDEVGRATGLPISTVSSTLALMELKGLVRQVGGMNYVRAREAGPLYRVD